MGIQHSTPRSIPGKDFMLVRSLLPPWMLSKSQVLFSATRLL